MRELRTAIEHGVVMSTGPKIGLRELPLAVREGARGEPGAVFGQIHPAAGASRFNLHETEHRLILQALEDTGGNVTQAAKKLGISRRTLHRKINELKATTDGDLSKLSVQAVSSTSLGGWAAGSKCGSRSSRVMLDRRASPSS